MRKACLFFIALVLGGCCSTLSHGAATGPQSVSLRGYGVVTAKVTPSRSAFICASPQQADILFGKLLADLFWDAGDAVRTQSVRVGRIPVIVRTWEPYGALCIGRNGKQVILVGGQSLEAVATLVAKEPLLLAPACVFTPAGPYPRYLDFYDLRVFKACYRPMAKDNKNYQPIDRWNFAKKFLSGGLVFGADFAFHNPAPNAFELTQVDYEVQAAEQAESMLTIQVGAGGSGPLWYRNTFPDAVAKASPLVAIGTRGSGSWGGHMSWGTPRAVQQTTNLAFLNTVMARYRNRPGAGGWYLFTGLPGYETNYHDRMTEYFDYSPTAQQSFRTWLRETCGYTLAQMGVRWHGDARHFASWNDITIPDVNSFFGKLDATCFRFIQGWEWQLGLHGNAATTSTTGWTPIVMPPNQLQGLLPRGASTWRVTFDASVWLAARTGKPIYLVADMYHREPKGARLFLNGEDLGYHRTPPGPMGYAGILGLDITKWLKPGANTLAIEPGGEGYIMGPVFLTTTQPVHYPYLGARENARYVDVKRWQDDAYMHELEVALAEMRRVDPNRPIILSSHTYDRHSIQVSDLAVRYNCGVENTGREASYRPWGSGLGYVAGFYSTSEPSNYAFDGKLDQMMGWLLYDGDSSHELVYILDGYMDYEKKTGWFTKNQRLLNLLGKAMRTKPEVVLFQSPLTKALEGDVVHRWDLGPSGEMDNNHYDFGYATERELLNGQIDDFPVLFDCATQVMEPKTVEALKRYVTNGGTYIATHLTGRHSLLSADDYPLERLTGFKMLATANAGTVHFNPELPLLRGFAGKAFGSNGGLRLQAATPDGIALAHWDDGSVAVGYRRLGKGRIIVLGSDFWRYGTDKQGIWRNRNEIESAFFASLFTDAGIRRKTSSTAAGIWTRKLVEKNGLQDWGVAFNSTNNPVTAGISFQADRQPKQVWDLIAQQPVEFTYVDGMVTLANVAFTPYETRIYSYQRADLAGGVSTWWDEKVRYWSDLHPVKVTTAPALVKQPGDTIPLDQWKLLADRDGSVARAGKWLQSDFNDRAWKTVERGVWQVVAPELVGYTGTVLYRASVTLPSAWTGRKIFLGMQTFWAPILYDHGIFYVNGKPVIDYSARYSDSQSQLVDITAWLHPGVNTIALAIDQAQDLGGLACAVWLAADRPFTDAINLDAAWTMFANIGQPTGQTNLPTKASTLYLERAMTVPAVWRGRRIALRVDTDQQCIRYVMVNGEAISYHKYGHQFGKHFDLDITDKVQPGQPAVIQLWAVSTVDERALATLRSFPVTQVVLGTLPPDEVLQK